MLRGACAAGASRRGVAAVEDAACAKAKAEDETRGALEEVNR